MSMDSGESTMTGPLSDVRLIDLTWGLAGPFGSMLLCDLGAEVIKIERPPWGDYSRSNGPHIDGVSSYFFSINRGKKSVMIDLSTERGRELLKRLADKADVLLENFTPGTMDDLGLGYEALSERNPRLIYAATSGFGQTGPYREKPALDIIVQGLGGIMSITGEPGGPPVRPGVSYGDILGGIFTATGVLAALHERERSGQGQFVDVAMFDCQITVLENAFARYFASGETPKPLGTRHPLATPFQAFPTKDGYIVIALRRARENQWGLFCAAIERPALIDDPRFQTTALRTEHHAELEPILNDALSRRTTADWLETLEPLGIMCAPLNDIPSAAADPQVKAREMLVEVADEVIGRSLTIANTPFQLSRTSTGVRGRAPHWGEHTYEVLTGLLGLTRDEVDELIAAGVCQAGPPAEWPY